MNRMRPIEIALSFLLVVASAIAAEPKQPISHETLWLFKQVGAPVPSPDGRWVVVPVTEPAFTAKREGDEAGQIYVIDLRGGEARRLTTNALGARLPQWSPDGMNLLFQGPVHRGAADEAANKKIADDRKKAKSKVRIYDGFPVRHWDKWLDDVQTHLFVIPADASAAARDLLAGSGIVKTAGFRGVGEEGASDTLQPEWAPDSKSIVFTATTNLHVGAYDEPVHHLYEVSLGGGEPRQLTTGHVSYSNPSFTPDGTRLCFTTNAGKGKIYAINRLASAAWPWDGKVNAIAPSFDRSVASFAFSPDGRTIYFTAEDAGRIPVWSVPVSGGEPAVALDTPEGVWLSMRIPDKAATPLLFANWESATSPAEVYRVDLSAVRQTRLTSFNVEKAAGIDWRPLREFWFTNKLGRKIHRFIALPPAFDESVKYPLLVLIHGGHASTWRDSITRRWNYHLLAQPGYVVLLTDYVGSTGYGEKFTLDILGDPLRGPADDINAAADEAIRRFPFIDGSRQAAAGASYGGHLANWLEATTTRYKCLVSHAGLTSLYSQWATSDSIYHRELMMGGPFWEKPQVWLDQSPAMYAKEFKTPMLLSIGENDFRVPLNNVLEMWSLLQRQRVPSRMLVWPDENHWIAKGENSRVFYKEFHNWLAQWLGSGGEKAK
jgi:dipeptidyl aminopeptidase/acylaminoacyl peptidase